MLRPFILGGAALAALVIPVVADAQDYGYNRDYSYHRDHDRNNNTGAVIAGALVGGVLGYALGSSHGYNYPSYGYSYPSYGYGSYGYSNYAYPGYGYNYGYANPSYGYDGGYGYRGDDDDGD